MFSLVFVILSREGGGGYGLVPGPFWGGVNKGLH